MKIVTFHITFQNRQQIIKLNYADKVPEYIIADDGYDLALQYAQSQLGRIPTDLRDLDYSYEIEEQ